MKIILNVIIAFFVAANLFAAGDSSTGTKGSTVINKAATTGTKTTVSTVKAPATGTTKKTAVAPKTSTKTSTNKSTSTSKTTSTGAKPVTTDTSSKAVTTKSVADKDIILEFYYECPKCKKEYVKAGKCALDKTELVKKVRSYSFICGRCGFFQGKEGKCPFCKIPLKKYEILYQCLPCNYSTGEAGDCPKCKQPLKKIKIPPKSFK